PGTAHRTRRGPILPPPTTLAGVKWLPTYEGVSLVRFGCWRANPTVVWIAGEGKVPLAACVVFPSSQDDTSGRIDRNGCSRTIAKMPRLAATRSGARELHALRCASRLTKDFHGARNGLNASPQRQQGQSLLALRAGE